MVLVYIIYNIQWFVCSSAARASFVFPHQGRSSRAKITNNYTINTLFIFLYIFMKAPGTFKFYSQFEICNEREERRAIDIALALNQEIEI